MTLCSEQIVAAVKIDRIVNIKQQVEILDCLGEEEALLTILKAHILDIMHRGITTPGDMTA